MKNNNKKRYSKEDQKIKIRVDMKKVPIGTDSTPNAASGSETVNSSQVLKPNLFS